MEEENTLYKSLSIEAEALKLRTEATEDCMHTLHKRLSDTTVEIPVAPPRKIKSQINQIVDPTAPQNVSRYFKSPKIFDYIFASISFFLILFVI